MVIISNKTIENESFIIPSPNKTSNNLSLFDSEINVKGDTVSVLLITALYKRISLRLKFILNKFIILKKYVERDIITNVKKVPKTPKITE